MTLDDEERSEGIERSIPRLTLTENAPGPPASEVQQVPIASEFRLDSGVLPPVHANTDRGSSQSKVIATLGGSQTARIRFAPPPRSKPPPSETCLRPSRVHQPVGKTFFGGDSSSLKQKQLETAQCFNILEQWTTSVGPGALKTLLGDVHDVLYEAIYRRTESKDSTQTEELSNESTDEFATFDSHKVEYFSLAAEVNEKVKLQKQERNQLSTRLMMEKALQKELTGQVRGLENELKQLHLRHVYNRAEIEAERRTLQHLETEYALLTEEEKELQQDCEVLELQLDTQRAQLKELRSQQLYLDFVSSAPLKRHLEEKKWQEQHATVAVQVQNAEAENKALETEIKDLEDKLASLDEQYTQDIQTKQQCEVALTEIQATYEQVHESFERKRTCYTPRPDWDRIVEDTPELSVQKYQWEIAASLREHEAANSTSEADSNDDYGILQSVDETAKANDAAKKHSRGRTKSLVKEMLNWIERLQKHCGVNLHLSRIWHDVEEARVQLNILHHQLDRAVRKNSALGLITPNAFGVITIAAPGSASSPSKPRQDYIMALGMHEGVPMFLRHCGKLKHVAMKKVDVEKMVRKVLVEKQKRELRNPLGRFSLEQVLYEKLYHKYGFQPLIAEWGYNLLVALQMFSWDAEIEMFLLCLTGAISDLAYVDQEQMIHRCQQLLLQLCAMYNVESVVNERRVLLKDALVALRTFFPLKTSGQLQAIEQAIIRDMHKMKRGGNDSILYIDDILPLDVKYPLGFFVKTIRTQHFKEIQDFYCLVLSELEQRDADQKGVVPLSAVRDAILTIDPLAERAAVDNILVKAMHVKAKAQLRMREQVHYHSVLKKMNATGLMKFTLNYDPHAEINWRRRQSSVYSGNTSRIENP